MELTTLRTTEETTWRLHETVKDEYQADALLRFYKDQVGYTAVKYKVRIIGFASGATKELFEIYVMEFKGGKL